MSTAFAVYMTALCLNPVEKETVDQVDLIEVNHFYDEQGRLVFDQIIFYDWCAAQSRYHVRDWRLLKKQAQVPLRQWSDGYFVAVWHDFKDRDLLRKVKAKMMRETWTQYDPELLEREFLPQEKRRELRKATGVLRSQAESSQLSRGSQQPRPDETPRSASQMP